MTRHTVLASARLAALGCFLQVAGCGGGTDPIPVPPPAPPSPYKYAQCLGNTVPYAGTSLAGAQAGAGSVPPASRPHVAGEVLIRFAGNVTREEAGRLVPRWGARILNDRVVRGDPWGRWVKATLPEGAPLEAALQELAARPEVETVQPNYIYRIAARPDDPDYGQLWGLENTGQLINDPRDPGFGVPGVDMDMPPAWDEATDCSAVRVAVIDTGVNYDHQDLAASLWDGTGCPAGYGGCPHHGWDFVGAGDDDPMDMNGHGTHVAGIIGAVGDNALGVTGVCWGAQIMAVRSMQADGAGTSEDISEGMRFAADAGAKVINMSLGGSGADPILLAAAQHIRNAGAILVAAAGNAAANTDLSFNHPGCINLDNIINVAAVNREGGLASFSNYGAVSVDVAGPGASVLSTYAGLESYPSLGTEAAWQASSSTGGGWAFSSCGLPRVTRVLADPSDFCSGGLYADGTDDRTWLVRNLSAYDSAYLLFYLNLQVGQGDYFRAAYRTAGGDPFAGGTTLFSMENTTSENDFLLWGIPLDGCAGASDCSFGFQLETGPAGRGRGVAMERSPDNMLLVGLQFRDNVYEYMNGTSMAAPSVAGVAALLWARYPAATYPQIILAIFDGTVPLASLRGKTCTGGMVNARNSLDLLGEWLQ